MMRLFYSPFHGFVHKALVVAHEAGLTDQVIYVPTFPFRNTRAENVRGQYPMTAINPLGKVPTLTLDDGRALYGSQCIVEYLDSLNTGVRLFPPEGPQRWDALRRLAMGDTLFDIAVQMSTEGRVPPAEPRPGLFEWLQPKAVACFDFWESEAANYGRFDIGHVGMLQGISYSASAYVSRAEEPLYPDFDWRAARPQLAAWYDKVIQRPSVQAYLNKPFQGDTSPAFFQQQLQAVLAARSNR